jgi:carbonic anhydrase/acetyltransferase-like protein (isoleucine patch superfamily)
MGCTNIQDFPIGHVSRKTDQKPLASSLIIGDYVTIGHGVILHGCEIGNECLIGMGSIVMDDVKVSSRVMIGAGSLIPPEKVLEGGFLYVGRPAEKVRLLTAAESVYLKYSAEQHVQLKDSFLPAV